MVRPRRCRKVGFKGEGIYLKPAGIPVRELETVLIKVDELEALRLKDVFGYDQNECAKKMEISQPTFHRLLLDARKKVADAVINKKALKVEGGDFY